MIIYNLHGEGRMPTTTIDSAKKTSWDYNAYPKNIIINMNIPQKLYLIIFYHF